MYHDQNKKISVYKHMVSFYSSLLRIDKQPQYIFKHSFGDIDAIFVKTSLIVRLLFTERVTF